MYTIRTLNNIAKTGLAKLPEQNFVIDEKAENPEGIILRSFDMHKMELNENLLAVARAGAGTNNIPIEKCTQKGVPVFNTPGAKCKRRKGTGSGRTVCILQTHHCRGSLGTGAEGQLRKRGKGGRGRQEGFHRPWKLRARPWVSSVWVRLAYRLPMRHWIWGWRLSATTPSFPLKCMALIPQRGA